LFEPAWTSPAGSESMAYVDCGAAFCNARCNARAELLPHDVAGVIDPEQARIGLPRGVEIVDRDRGVIALRVGHRPLPELVILGTEHQHQAMRAADDLALLDHHRDEHIVGIDAD